MVEYNLTEKDIQNNYFHFTAKSNLASIEKLGLIPKKGYNARYIEKNKKIFFVEGLDNLLILFDCWINVYYYMPKIPFIYTLGAYLLRQKWFPQIIADVYFGFLKKTKLHRKRSYKVFNKLLDNSCVLNLALEENTDFRYDDTDEIKIRKYKKRHLELMGYSQKYSTLENTSMDKWNMHCLVNHKISKDKIKICSCHGSHELRDIFLFAIKNTKLDLEDKCPKLYGYLKYMNYIK